MAEYDKIERAKAKLAEAKQKFSSDKNEAMIALSAAHVEAREHIGWELPLISLPVGVQLDRQAKDLFQHANRMLTFIALGVDVTSLFYVGRFLPPVTVSMAGTYHSNLWRQYDQVDENTFQMCVNVIENLIQKADELERKTAPWKKLTAERR